MDKPGGYHPVHLGDALPKKPTCGSREPKYRPWPVCYSMASKRSLGPQLVTLVNRQASMSSPLINIDKSYSGYVAVKINVSLITGENNRSPNPSRVKRIWS